MLYTSTVTNQLFEVAWRKLETTLKGQGMTSGSGYELIDGAGAVAAISTATTRVRSPLTPLICRACCADPVNKELRTALWGISEKRSYPQVFVRNNFVGDMDGIQELLDSGNFATVFDGFANSPTPP